MSTVIVLKDHSLSPENARLFEDALRTFKAELCALRDRRIDGRIDYLGLSKFGGPRLAYRVETAQQVFRLCKRFGFQTTQPDHSLAMVDY
jgi:hypothetical protein